VEVAGVVGTLNRLFDQVSQSLQSQSDFIANAAHQLRNPIAGVLSLAEAVASAKTPEQVAQRSEDLLLGAEVLDVGQALDVWLKEDQKFKDAGVTLTLALPGRAVMIKADPTMLREAFVNLLDNALAHGGARLSDVSVALVHRDGRAVITVRDNGQGLPAADMERALERFVHIGKTGMSGLGLPIAAARPID